MSKELIIFKNDTDAPATNRGFIYQYLKTMVQWLEIYCENTEDLIYCEVEDDIKKVNYKNRTVEWTQVKCYSSVFNLEDNNVIKTLYNFYMLYLHYEEFQGKFFFESNSKPSSKDIMLIKWIEKQSKIEVDTELFNYIISYLQINLTRKFHDSKSRLIKKKNTKLLDEDLEIIFEQKINDITYLSEFINRIYWKFDNIDSAESINHLKDNLLKKLEDISFEKKVHPSIYFNRLLSELILKSSLTDSLQRYVDRNLFVEILNETEEELRLNTSKEVSGLIEKLEHLCVAEFGTINKKITTLQEGISFLFNYTNNLINKWVEDSIGKLYFWEEGNKHYIKTSFYETAMSKLESNKFVVILGERNIGKTSVAYSLCLELIKKYTFQPYIINVKDIDQCFSYREFNRIYIFDDIFGVTSFKNKDDYNDFFEKLHCAQKKGAFIIFTSNIYLYNRFFRDERFKYNFPSVLDKTNLVYIKDFTESDRKLMLLEYVKNGDLSKEMKNSIQPHLVELSRHNNFKPQLAQCLGDKEFWKGKNITRQTLLELFDKPNDFMQVTFEQLNKAYKAALLLILVSPEGLSDPIKEDSINKAIKNHFEIKTHEINEALKDMENVLVELQTINNRKVWVSQKPYFKNAILPIFKKQIDLFINLAEIKDLLNQTCFPKEDHDIDQEEIQYVCIYENYWNVLSEKLIEYRFDTTYLEFSDQFFNYRRDLQEFFLYNASEKFMKHFFHFSEESKAILNELTINYYSNLTSQVTYEYATKMLNLKLLNDKAKNRLLTDICEKVQRNFDVIFFFGKLNDLLDDHTYYNLLVRYSEIGLDLALEDIEDKFNDNEDFYLNTEKSIQIYYDNWLYEVDLMEKELKKYNLWYGDTHEERKMEIIEQADEAFNDVVDRIENKNDEIFDFIDNFISNIESIDEPDYIKEEIQLILDTLAGEMYLTFDEAIEELVCQLRQNEKWYSLIVEKINLCKDKFFDSICE